MASKLTTGLTANGLVRAIWLGIGIAIGGVIVAVATPTVRGLLGRFTV